MNRCFVLCTLYFVLFLVSVSAQKKSWLTVRSDSATFIVYVDSMLIGETPLDSVSINSGAHILRFVQPDSRSWFHVPLVETVSVSVEEHLFRKVAIPRAMFSPHAMLIHANEKITNDSGSILPSRALANGLPSNNIPLYLTSSAAVLSGAVAAYFKIQADNMYDEFERTGDQSALDKVKRYDTVSGIALGVCEINIGLLAYILLSK